MITIYPLCEGKPPPLKAYFSHKDNYIALSVLHLNAGLASRCYNGGRRRIRCELLGVFPKSKPLGLESDLVRSTWSVVMVNLQCGDGGRRTQNLHSRPHHRPHCCLQLKTQIQGRQACRNPTEVTKQSLACSEEAASGRVGRRNAWG